MARVCKGDIMGSCLGDEPLSLKRCHSCELQQLYEALEGQKSVCDQAHNFKGIKGKFYFFKSFSFSSLLLLLISWHDACRTRGGGNWLKYNK